MIIDNGGAYEVTLLEDCIYSRASYTLFGYKVRIVNVGSRAKIVDRSSMDRLSTPLVHARIEKGLASLKCVAVGDYVRVIISADVVSAVGSKRWELERGCRSLGRF